MSHSDASEIAEKLADRAEAVCRKYLPKGFKSGNYWMVGNITGAAGQSMHVRLRGPLSGRGAAGKWADEATGQYGNLLDVIQHTCGYGNFIEVLAEARRFLSLPDPRPAAPGRRIPAAQGLTAARDYASRLFTSGRGLAGTIAETYLLGRGITLQPDFDALRFDPRCFHTRDEAGRAIFWPALIAAVTGADRSITGIQRTYLADDGNGKAPVDPTRRSKGDILGNGVRFGSADDVMAAGEGVETTLSLRAVLPTMPLVAATGSNQLAALQLPPTLRTLLVIRDNDGGGDMATDALFWRCRALGIDFVLIDPKGNDLNKDLMELGRAAIAGRLRSQMPASLIERFLVA